MSAVVLDTNVVVAAFAARGLCESVFELCLARHELVTSEFLLGELREKLVEKIRLPEGTAGEIVDLYRRNSRLVVPAELAKETCRDPEDVPVLGTCISGQADYLISGDKDLLEIGSIGSTAILTPRRFHELQACS